MPPLVDRSVTAVERTLSILGAFISNGGVCSLTELEQETGLFKSVICRYMLSFERHGYITKRADGRYQLGSQALRLGKAFEQAFDLSQYVMPALQKLAETTHETASFYVREGEMRLCLYRIESPSALKVTIHPGTRLKIDKSATGQVLSRFGERRRTRKPDPADFVRSSVNYPSSGAPDHVASASAPVFGVDHHLLGALTVSGPMSRFSPEENIAARKALCLAARALSEQFGGAGLYPENEDWLSPIQSRKNTVAAGRAPLRQK